MSNARDRVLECADCGSTFVFTAGEQEFYQERGFSDPKRCPNCRASRKSGRPSSGGRSGAGGGSYGRGGSDRGGGGRRDRQPRKMYDVICAACGEPTQVPFEPRDDRPVYCKDCYQNQRR
jgi:CxxC-x17-CxxC domain-containing protein